MTKENLKAVFTKPYNRENWQNLIHAVFPGVTFFSLPHPIPVPNEEIKEFYHTGNIRLNDGKSLAIFELHVSDKIKLKINRVALHTEISKYIDQESHHGVLALFDSNSKDYRFTFTAKDSQITEAGFETKVTDAKRYTYVFGPNETCRTAIDRFEILANKRDNITIDDVEDAFSVEKLNKEFFKQYKEQYEKFVCFITGKHFVKKKGKWVEEVVHEPHEYLNSIFENNDKQARDFIKKSLGRLVFLYFLQKKGWIGCSPNSTEWNDGDQKFMQHYFENCQDKDNFHSKFLVPLYFECLNLKRDNDVFEPTNSRIPYLNGGLFEEDKLKTNEIDFPTEYWENLFNFFDQYNFTIDENDPFEQEVGIDPEMLGHIFENLLEDNKDKGAFYTPKPIVEYMCKESLIQYLKTHLFSNSNDSAQDDNNSDKVEALENFIRNHDPGDPEDKNNYIRNNAEQIEKLLDDVKICDPAIGSGAFPMGLLQEIFWAKMTLDWTLNPADTKKKIIENSIYGVDIDSGAIDIARLRFWLSLIVDAEEPEPLPNLDYKIMQGNSLLESFEGIDLSNVLQVDYKPKTIVEEPEQADLFDNEPKQQALVLEDHDVNSIVELKHTLFQSFDPREKEDCKKQIDKIVMENIEFNLNIKRDKLNIEIDRIKNKIRVSLKVLHSYSQVKQCLKKNCKKDVKELAKKKKELFSLNTKYKKLEELQHTTDRPFFLWHLYFSEVFDEKGGFDIVIGNPPYGSSIDKNQLVYIKNKLLDTENSNSAALFIDFTKNQFLGMNGVLTLIVPKSLLYSQRWFSLVKALIPNTTILVDVEKAFDEVLLEQVLFIYNANKSQKNYQAVKFKDDKFTNKINIENELVLTLESWICDVTKNDIEVMKKILHNKLKFLNELTDTKRGIGFQKHLKETGDFRVIGGKNISKYFIDDTKGYISKEMLRKYKKKLEFMQNSKIVSQDLVAHVQNPYPHLVLMSALDLDGNIYSVDTVQNTIILNKKYDHRLVLALLNSKLISWYVYKFVYCSAIRTMHFDKYYIGKIPLLLKSIESKNNIIDIVEEILVRNDKYNDIQSLENQIDLMVYKLYELNYEEAMIVDPELDKVLAEFGLSKEDFERMGVEELADLEV